MHFIPLVPLTEGAKTHSLMDMVSEQPFDLF